MTRSLALVSVVAALLVSGCRRQENAVADTAKAELAAGTHEAEVLAWRQQHEADYRRDFVTISGLHFLAPGTHTIGSRAGNGLVIGALPPVAGKVIVEGNGVRFEPAPGVNATQEQKPVTGTATLKAPDGRASNPVVINGVSLAIHVTGERLALRVRDPNGAPAKAFKGFSWFTIDPAYRVVGRFVRDAAPRQLQVANTFSGIDTYSSEGVVEFRLGDRTLRLRPFTTRPKRFYFVFRDASSGTETYETARFLYADLADDGSVVMDFNQAYNPPCAFNKYTTCPLPLKENVLPVKILAGERAYGYTETGTRGGD